MNCTSSRNIQRLHIQRLIALVKTELIDECRHWNTLYRSGVVTFDVALAEFDVICYHLMEQLFVLHQKLTWVEESTDTRS